MIRVFIPGAPDTHTQQQRKIAWAQHRTYLPKAVQRNKQTLCNFLRASKHPGDGTPWDEPVELLVRYYFPRPNRTHSKIWKDTKPDADNMIKALCDAIEKSGIVVNDSRIARILIEKHWADDKHRAGTEIILTKLSEEVAEDFFISEQRHSKDERRDNT